MVTQETRNAYSEVFEFLKYIDRTELDRIPMEILQTIKENKNNEYNPEIDYNNIKNSLSNKAANIYVWLYMTYIANTKEEKNRIYSNLYENEMKANEELKYNGDLFNKTVNYTENVPKEEKNMMVEYKPSFIQSIINKIKAFFKKK